MLTKTATYLGYEIVRFEVPRSTRDIRFHVPADKTIPVGTLKEVVRAIRGREQVRKAEEERKAAEKAVAQEHGESSALAVVRKKVGSKPKRPEPVSTWEGGQIYKVLGDRKGGVTMTEATVTGLKRNSGSHQVFFTHGLRGKPYKTQDDHKHFYVYDDAQKEAYIEALRLAKEADEAFKSQIRVLNEFTSWVDDGYRVDFGKGYSPAYTRTYPFGFMPDMADDEPVLAVEVAGVPYPAPDSPYSPESKDILRAARVDLGILDLNEGGRVHSYASNTLLVHGDQEELARVLLAEARKRATVVANLRQAAATRFMAFFDSYEKDLDRYRAAAEQWQDQKREVLS